jgi:small subunit ribosomal protein S4
MHGPEKKGGLTSYGIQVREKQKVKRMYGILERQFRNYFRKAAKKKGDTTQYFVRLLETRLDNVIYRLGFARSRHEARFFLSHGHFTVNGHKVNIPSYAVKPGDIIEVKPKSRDILFFRDIIAPRLSKHQPPSWLDLDPKQWRGKVLNLPEGDDLKQGFDAKLIIEYYSR